DCIFDHFRTLTELAWQYCRHLPCLVIATISAVVFFFDEPATAEIYTLSLHDALPISAGPRRRGRRDGIRHRHRPHRPVGAVTMRSEEHTSELQSRENLVCRLLLEKKKDIGHCQFKAAMASMDSSLADVRPLAAIAWQP